MSVHGPLGATPQTGAIELRSRTLDPRAPALGRRGASLGSRLGAVGLAGVLLTGLAISIAASHTDNLLPESTRPIPGWVAGPFGGTSVNLHPGGLIAVLMLMFGCYVLAARAAHGLSARAVLMTIAAFHALMLLT